MTRLSLRITSSLAVVALAALTACSDHPTAPLPRPAASVASLSSCGFEQLSSAPTSITLPSEISGNTDPVPVPIRGVTVTADFPHQWFGTNGTISVGTMYVTDYGPTTCTTSWGTTYADAGPLNIETDSLAAEDVPDGVDPIAWRMMPSAVRRLIKDLSNMLVQRSTVCAIPEVGPVSCATMTSWATTRIFNIFNDAYSRSLNDFSSLDNVAMMSGFPGRRLDYAEFERLSSFALGCALQGRLHTGDLQGYLTPAEAEEWASKLGGAWSGIMLNPLYQYLEPTLSELTLSGARAAREGNACLSVAQSMLLAPQGSNIIVNGGMNGGGGGGTQF